jgi:nucleoside-diphosphate-sugar epimerase
MILLTGATGFIGTALQQRFSKDDIVTIGRQAGDQSISEKHVIFDLASGDGRDVLRELRKFDVFSHIIHLAGVTPWASNPDFSLDLTMAATIAMLCKELQVPSLLFMSGWVVYDPQAAMPFSEETTLAPATPYGQSKVAVEKYFEERLTNTRLINMRAASIYGPGQVTPGLIPNLVGQALRGEPIRLGSRTTRRDYLYINDMAEVIQGLTAIDLKDQVLNLNIGSGQSISVYKVAETIQEVCRELYGDDIPIIFDEPLHEGTPADNQLSIQRLHLLGIMKNPTPFKEGLRAYIQWRKHENIL